MNHTLLPIDEFVKRRRPLHHNEMLVALVSVMKGHSVMICYCNWLIAGKDYKVVQAAHERHLREVVLARRGQ